MLLSAAILLGGLALSCAPLLGLEVQGGHLGFAIPRALGFRVWGLGFRV